MIVLHARTPEKVGFLMLQQICNDIGDHTLPDELEGALRSRNTPPDAKPGTYDSVSASYAKLAFDGRIVVAGPADPAVNREAPRKLCSP